MKIAVTGKGGVGKTTVAAILARLYAEEGRNVLAVDVDPDANLGLALGFSEEEPESITPISKMKELIQDRTGVDPEGISKMFRLNPKVDDIPEKFAKTCNGVKLLVLGTVDVAGAGCVCPEHVILKQLISHLVIQNQDVVIMDMEAGLEHLGRGTTSFMDRFIVVVEPGTRSIQTFKKVRELAFDLGIPRVEALANKVRGPEDEEFIRNNVAEDELLGFVHYSNGVIEADRQGRSPFEMDDAVVSEIRRIKEKIDKTH